MKKGVERGKKRTNLRDQVRGFIVTGSNQQTLERLNCAGGDRRSRLKLVRGGKNV